jgi:hypothetical protein
MPVAGQQMENDIFDVQVTHERRAQWNRKRK